MIRTCYFALIALLGFNIMSAQAQTYLESIHHHGPLASSIPHNGDLNPYAIIVAPVSSGTIQKGDILVDNFNNMSNLQGTGGTIVALTPGTQEPKLFASLPQSLPQCPGGIGLTSAMTMLSAGWVIVGSTPSKDGTTATLGQGCLIVLNTHGEVADVWLGPLINGPWGNIALQDNGTQASLFVSMAGAELRAPSDKSEIIKKGTIVRFDLTIPPNAPPQITSQSVIADGLSERADKDVFLIGPTGLALIDTILYVSDSAQNRILSIPDALSRKESAGTGRVVTENKLLQRPLAMAATPNGHLLTTNGKNGQVVEIDPLTGQQLAAKWMNTNQAQTPPGSGNLFGLTIAPDGSGFYYVEDDTNMISKATP